MEFNGITTKELVMLIITGLLNVEPKVTKVASKHWGKMIELNKGGGQRGQSDKLSTQRFSSCIRCMFTVADLFARRHWSCLCTVPLCVCTVLLSDSPGANISWFKNVLWLCRSMCGQMRLFSLALKHSGQLRQRSWCPILTFRTVLFPTCWWPGMVLPQGSSL